MEILEASQLIADSKNTIAFTGAGISVESGIPPFRGPNGLWSKYDPKILDLEYYSSNPNKSWTVIKKLFFDYFRASAPNEAHNILAKWEKNHLLKSIITQNIDSLHQKSGSKNVIEFHGTSNSFVCTKCHETILLSQLKLTPTPPICKSFKCKGLLKPNFIFFGEGIPQKAYLDSIEVTNSAEVFIIIGTSGEIMPASYLPPLAKDNGAQIIEINTDRSSFTDTITDIFLQGRASEILTKINREIISILTK
jgi:NAD-dependent deacetylase